MLETQISIRPIYAERTYFNTAKLNWNTRRLGAYIGYRYGRRELTGDPSGESTILNSYYLVTNGVPDAPENTTKINENTALGGIVYRPTDAWRINADLELQTADNAFTNIAPATPAAAEGQYHLQGEPLVEHQWWRTFRQDAE